MGGDGNGAAPFLARPDARYRDTFIEASGGRFADERPGPAGAPPVRRYWIHLR